MLTLSQWGLISDIIGVVMLFAYGFPSKIESDSVRYLRENTSEADTTIRRNKRITILGYVGLLLVLIGFILQFINGFK